MPWRAGDWGKNPKNVTSRLNHGWQIGVSQQKKGRREFQIEETLINYLLNERIYRSFVFCSVLCTGLKRRGGPNPSRISRVNVCKARVNLYWKDGPSGYCVPSEILESKVYGGGGSGSSCSHGPARQWFCSSSNWRRVRRVMTVVVSTRGMI